MEIGNWKLEIAAVPTAPTQTGPANGPLPASSIPTIKIPFSIKQGVRDDDPPHLQALREALVNLIIHTDYFSSSNPRIRIFSDRFEFYNPGALPKEIELILKEDFSLPRNPVLAKLFRYIRFAENIGSGFHKMIGGWTHRYHLKPVIEGDFDLIVAKLAKQYDIKIIHVSDVKGVLDEKGKVIPVISTRNYKKVKAAITGSKLTDVTGGMIHKVEESLTLAKKYGIEVVIGNNVKGVGGTKIL